MFFDTKTVAITKIKQPLWWQFGPRYCFSIVTNYYLRFTKEVISKRTMLRIIQTYLDYFKIQNGRCRSPRYGCTHLDTIEYFITLLSTGHWYVQQINKIISKSYRSTCLPIFGDGLSIWLLLLSRRIWRLISAQLSNKFGYCPSCTLSLLFWHFINTPAYHWADTSLHITLAVALPGLSYV